MVFGYFNTSYLYGTLNYLPIYLNASDFLWVCLLNIKNFVNSVLDQDHFLIYFKLCVKHFKAECPTTIKPGPKIEQILHQIFRLHTKKHWKLIISALSTIKKIQF